MVVALLSEVIEIFTKALYDGSRHFYPDRDVNHLLAPAFTFGQASFGIWLWLALLPLIVVPILRWRTDIKLRILVMLSQSLPWVLLSYWTSMRWHKGEEPRENPIDAGVAIVAIAATVIVVGFSIYKAKGARWEMLYAGILNFWLSLVGGLLCIMATSGSWI